MAREKEEKQPAAEKEVYRRPQVSDNYLLCVWNQSQGKWRMGLLLSVLALIGNDVIKLLK